ncbi:tRNA (guanosine(18)-2'-O)-methyltransferase TrmH [Umboniibacter marinipuniceus]|uniref:tRNA (guanosine(18)-2'-O)-methyltransferase n=1 Tax=Umboniibacter marinipuniceus TaxID=569599 RepID=A0A3M0A909_9GAMM|nr:tRNA (guanosine(18)-2'-O)-methyltransferase TrmH [Umboniibacter marinipuniceus]RMA81096.1 tRNA (guanosine-2'-O-)-methyltransferase [Umboniibacter marinipuniceus]
MTPERFAFFNHLIDHRQLDLTLVNDGIHKQQNLSAILRTCDAVGIARIHRVFDHRSARTFRGTAAGSHKWVDVVTHETSSEAILPLKEQGFQIVAAHLTESSVDFKAIDYTKPTAIVMGNEKFGVSDEALALCDHVVTIPMIGAVESLNVSVAAALILYEAMRQREHTEAFGVRQMGEEAAQKLLFEVTQPRLMRYCIEKKIDYPELDENGELRSPERWIAALRAQK